MGALVIFAAGCLGLGLLAGVQFGRWSAFLFPRQQLRQLANPGHGREVPGAHPRVQVEHAGQYVDRDRVRAGVCGLEYPSFRRVS